MLGGMALAGTRICRRVLQRMPQARFRQIALALVFAIGWVTLYAALGGEAPP